MAPEPLLRAQPHPQAVHHALSQDEGADVVQPRVAVAVEQDPERFLERSRSEVVEPLLRARLGDQRRDVVHPHHALQPSAHHYAARVDSAREIENLLYTYAERIDAGDLDGVADLFAHGRIHGQENGPPETVFEGRDAVRALYGMATRIYEDTGTPKTKHLTTNAIIEVDESAGTASRPDERTP